MPDNSAIEHHRSITYSPETVPPPGPELTAVWSDDGQEIIVSAHCPGCGGYTEWEIPYILPGSGYKGRRKTPPPPPPLKPARMNCQCGHAHADRPDDDVFRGCGRAWTVDLRSVLPEPPRP